MVGKILSALALAYVMTIAIECTLEHADTCVPLGYLHRQSTIYLCRNEVYWGRIP